MLGMIERVACPREASLGGIATPSRHLAKRTPCFHRARRSSRTEHPSAFAQVRLRSRRIRHNARIRRDPRPAFPSAHQRTRPCATMQPLPRSTPAHARERPTRSRPASAFACSFLRSADLHKQMPSACAMPLPLLQDPPRKTPDRAPNCRRAAWQQQQRQCQRGYGRTASR